MALLSNFRTAVSRLWSCSQRTLRRTRLALQILEHRKVPAVGGGFTQGGLLGEYFDNRNLSGSPDFTRRDVRIDFEWQTRSPGGSSSPSFQRVGADNFSVRWTGQLIPRFSETYTFRTTSDDGVRLHIKFAGSNDWVELVNNWEQHASEENARSIALVAGLKYDVRMEYFESGGNATARLTWSSPSTPEEVIDPAVNLGVNAVTYDHQLYADAVKSGRADWGDPFNYFGRPLVATDFNGWPTKDAGHIFWEGADPTKTNGVYQLRFRGKAEVVSWNGHDEFRASGIVYKGVLPSGAGYNPATNTTIAEVVVSDADLFGLSFRRTQRTAGSPTNTGITDVRLMRPIDPGSGTYYQTGELFDRHVKDALSRFTTLRYLTANYNAESEWWERKRPDEVRAAWGDRRAVWEYQVMLANETGKDLYITIPINASDDYVRRLANLVRFGSDGVNPYEGAVSSPRYPGLNPNLRVYVEWANETWNWAFSQSTFGVESARAAARNNTQAGRIMNFDGQRPKGDFRRWTALRTVEASNTFRRIWGDEAMGERVRVVLEYQYDNQQDTAIESLRFLDNYFNNGDGRQHVSDPKPVSYYIWGAGGASYFGASNPRGLVNDFFVPDGNFEMAPVGNGQSRENAASPNWDFTGSAGVFRNAKGVGDNTRIPVSGLGAVPTTPKGEQALFVSGNGTATVTIDFPRGGVYAFDFRAAAEFGAGMGNPLDFYFDDRRVTPRGDSLSPNDSPWQPGTGYGRDASKFTVYGTVPVQINGPGRHTFRIVGRGNTSQTTVIDDIRVASTDAIFASQLPGGGQAAGQVSSHEYEDQLSAQAKYALAFGLKVVAYEGGWSLGGDTESVPIQSYAKYRDSRAAETMAEAIDAFHRAGGELNVLGTYDQWNREDSSNANDYPLVAGIDVRNRELPVDAKAGIVVPGTLSVAQKSADAINGNNTTGHVGRSEWISWNVLVPATADYKVSTGTTSGGSVELFVDGEPIVDGHSGSPLADTVRLTRGVHTVRVQNTSGSFVIRDITVLRVSGPVNTTPPPAPVTPPIAGLPAGWKGEDVGTPNLAGGSRFENGKWIVDAAGENIWGASDEFRFVHSSLNGDGAVTTRLESMEDTHSWAKAGVMIRAGVGESAAFAGLYRTPTKGLVFEWRSRYRGAPRSVTVDVGEIPIWMKLVRRGNSIAAFYSTDGQTWNRVGQAQTIVMPGGVQAGLAVTSHDVNRRTTARFSNVTID